MDSKQSFILSLLCVFLVNVYVADAGRQKRLLSGIDARPGEVKYIVALWRWNVHVCGGGLISEKHVLTGAHCFVGRADAPLYNEGLVVVTGMTKISRGGENHTAAFVTVHDGFVRGSQAKWINDIAVITLNNEVQTTTLQAPIPFAKTAITPPVKAFLAGWGSTSRKADAIMPDNLQKATVSIITKEECDKIGNPSLITHLCGFDGRDTGICGGDSGGPLVYQGKIVGIVSYGVSCGINYPDFYTKVSDYTTFIENAMARKPESLNKKI